MSEDAWDVVVGANTTTADWPLEAARLGGGPLVIDALGGNCPVQAGGTVDGWPFYFRARGECWSFEVAEPGFEACGEAAYAEHHDYGTWPEAGWMEAGEARRFIAQAAARFLAWRRSPEGARFTGDGRGTLDVIRERAIKAERRAGRLACERWKMLEEMAKLRALLGLVPVVDEDHRMAKARAEAWIASKRLADAP